MSTLPPPPTGVHHEPHLSVHGGSDSFAATLDDLTAIGELLQADGSDLALGAARLHRVGLDPGTMASAVFDPAGLARFEARLFEALDGPRGLVLRAAMCVGTGTLTVAAARSYRAADTITHDIGSTFHQLARLGSLITTTAGHLAANPFDARSWATAAAAVLGGAAMATPPGAPSAWNLALAASGTDPTVLLGLSAIARYQRVAPRPEHATTVSAPPRDVKSLMSGLKQCTGGEPGSVAVRFLHYPDGSRRVVVDIEGMDYTSPVTGLHAAVTSMLGMRTAYERGVAEAMKAAGVTSSDEVMLVGHSEGGMVAVNMAGDYSRQYHITHVITAGSPIALTAGSVPKAVQVLALENRADGVPQLDGRPNPTTANVTTVVDDQNTGDVAANHGMGQYVKIGADVDHSSDGSVLTYEAGMSRYLHASSMTTRQYVVAPSG